MTIPAVWPPMALKTAAGMTTKAAVRVENPSTFWVNC